MNLSSKELSALERSGLEKGLKFAIAPRKIPTADIVAAVEESISQLNDDRRYLVRAEVISILTRAKPPPKNIQKDVFNALIALKKDPDRLVLSADKGNCVVVMDKQQYHDKALSLLNDKNTYAVLNSDPTSKTQRKLNKMLLDLKKAGRISDSTYKMLYSSDGLCPRFYGLPYLVTKEQRTDAIYSIPCNDCDNEYIGQTKRQFGTRLKEHQKAVFLCKKEIQLYRSILA